MTESQFWQKASDILSIYKGRFNHVLLTDDEKTSDVGSFLNDMLELRDEWHNRNVPTMKKEKAK